MCATSWQVSAQLTEGSGTPFLPSCPSVAKCLGAKTVAARALECAQECQVISQVVEDTEAVRAVEQFLGKQDPAGGDRDTTRLFGLQLPASINKRSLSD
ncbi:serine dehydratase-like [Limosa lapponica baueri]|uniref:Serine dehydratase-like n=1 Tax=Limosa lapponica baueri TaxID=1758121 RepID=A0A2I0SZD3_LIMLA|nr:serine dehydratase-like [Limosa lapponica baueri]